MLQFLIRPLEAGVKREQYTKLKKSINKHIYGLLSHFFVVFERRMLMEKSHMNMVVLFQVFCRKSVDYSSTLMLTQ